MLAPTTGWHVPRTCCFAGQLPPRPCVQPLSQLPQACWHDIQCLLQVIRMVGESNETVAAGGVSGTGSNKMPTLDEYGNNLTQQAKEVGPRL